MLDKLKRLFKKEGKKEEQEQEFVEVEETSKEKETKILVRMEKIGNLVDVERIAKLVMQGNIILVNVKEFKARDLPQFQNAVQKLKRYCSQYGWDLVGIEDGYLVVTPRFAQIVRQ
jgi:SepF-like predicted cell division protein (DUF552 family)